ncbi:sensor domain-containing diguanylate cyclase [Metabacillus halosaccharovorans]|uniref:sensor domain-containing diguanylate cyclase n=1 Tax=Metabacillus halosaccharovorans TaxID=930124 RepID=UPI0020419D9F|nr:sensor domain-containing diguanylate cyclase [Metabacillus halosaccharovorans]MCM3443091.1 sensor domain-containing diguanylate cyclase [Metabacillus halosaccharovorans]
MNVGKIVWLIVISILFITNMTIYSTVSSWQNGISLTILSLMVLLPIWLSTNKIKQLTMKVDEMTVQQNLIMEQKEQLEEKISQLDQFIQGIAAPIFSFQVKENQYYFSESMKDTFDFTSTLPPFRQFEEKLHPQDKQRFIHDKEAWLSGNPSISKYRILRESDQIVWIEIRTNIRVNTSGAVDTIYGVVIDITKQVETEEHLKQMAYYDSLTNLPNRIMLQSHLKKVISRAKRKEHNITIMFVDLDGFKEINDTLGHDIGDALLKEVADRLNSGVREEDLISRIGGDEFIIVIEETQKEEIKTIADRILNNTSKPYLLNDHTISITPSIGISSYPDDGQDIETLIKNADKAMYLAKDKGKANFQFYTKELEAYQPKESLMGKFLKLFQK